MSKQIAYIAIDNGVDGREPDCVLYASFDEAEFNRLYEADKSKNWRRKSEVIVDEEKARAAALAKLDGIDRLALGLPAWPSK